MTTKEKGIPKAIGHKDLLRSIQELSLTLKALKGLAYDLKHKSERSSSTLNQNRKNLHDMTTADHNADQYTTLH